MAKKRARSSAKIKLSKSQLAQFSAATIDALKEYESTIESRTPAFAKVRVVELKAPEDYEGVPEGSVIGYFGQEGNKTLDQLYEAASGGDLKKIEQLHGRFTKTLVKGLEKIDPDKARGIPGIPVYGELRYRTKTISRAVFPETPSAVEIRLFPYNGGKLYDADFQLVNYPSSERAKPLTGVLIKRAPRLSELEAEILRQVPREQTEANIGYEAAFAGKILKIVTKATKKIVDATVDAAKNAWNWVTENKKATLEAFLLTTELTTMATGGCPALPGATSVQALGKSASAADLLAARRSALLTDLPQDLAR